MMHNTELLKLAMAMTPGMDGTLFKLWMESDESIDSFFTLPPEVVCSLLKISNRHPLARANRRESIQRARTELEFISGNNIHVYTADDEDYPFQLLQIHNPPAVLFTIGNGRLSSEHMVSVVGTRKPTAYGVKMCQESVAEWCRRLKGVTIVSGLAYGIDAMAHHTALECKSPTIAVVAHGLDRVYPSQHRQLARDIVTHGGLMVTEYPSKTEPYQRRFLERNRIIAGLSNATVVIESGYRGGALSTANTAFTANREVFAVPGRMTDEMSLGCNILIHRNKAHILTTPEDLITEMNWDIDQDAPRTVQGSLFEPTDPHQRMVLQLLRKSDIPVTVDAISNACNLDIRTTMVMLTEMEFDGLVVKHPGKRYSI